MNPHSISLRGIMLVTLTLLLVSCATSPYKRMPSKNYSQRVKSLVLHFTAINYEKSVHALVDEGGLSAHYLVPESNDPSYPGDEPEVIQLVDERERAWHAGDSYWQGRTNLNDHSIGIEIVNVPDCEWDKGLSPTLEEHGSNRLCVFPDYDPKQIELVIALTQSILSRNPDIEPTAVVGHADIAFDRKNDPGPRFPWYELYKAGVGAWYENDTLGQYWREFNGREPSIGLLQSALRAYGYGVTETGILDSHTLNALSAFQMHFLPWHVSGDPDSQTAGALFALLDKYFPQRLKRLMQRYENEASQLIEPIAEVKHGQIDEVFPQQERSEREWVNDRRGFKAYAGRGALTIESDTDTDISLAINGETLNLDSPVKAGTPYHYSLGRRTHTGINTLAFEGASADNAKIHITVPYPHLEDNTRAWASRFDKVDSLINQDIDNGFPGAVLLVIKDGNIIKHTAYGFARRYDENGALLDAPQPMTTSTGFDLASNTKMFATTLALMHLSATGQLDVTKPIYAYLPEYRGEGREARRVADLLSHQSGYGSEVQFFRQDNALAERFFSQSPSHTRELLATKVPFAAGNGQQVAYSDTNFMLLGMIVERITGMTLDQYCEQNLYAPLGLHDTLFTPLKKGRQPESFAATELNGNTRGGRITFPNIRTHTLQGQVHDEKAFYAMNGVSGHAGLFSTARDLGVLMQLLLNGGGYDTTQLFPSSVLNGFIRPVGQHWDFGLGWKRAANGASRWHFGPYASDSAFGHTGWTGTATVIDPALDLGIVLLTNARHSPIDEDEEGKLTFRGKTFETGRYGSVISLIYEAILANRPQSR